MTMHHKHVLSLFEYTQLRSSRLVAKELVSLQLVSKLSSSVQMVSLQLGGAKAYIISN